MPSAQTLAQVIIIIFLQLLVKLLKQGLSASCSDYDKRTACMVAAQEGQEVRGWRG